VQIDEAAATRQNSAALQNKRSYQVPAFNIGFVIFPQLTQLDFTGPLQVLARLPEAATHIVAKSTAPVPSDCSLSLLPTCTFATCPSLDLLCVPGGSVGSPRCCVTGRQSSSRAVRPVQRST
jgi:transcriptional regulator GlxA family with amidase domain